MEFRPSVLWDYRLFLLQGMVNTALLALAAQALALALAVPTAVARLRGGAVSRRRAGLLAARLRGRRRGTTSSRAAPGGSARTAMDDADRQMLVADVDDLDRSIDARLTVDRFHLFVGDVGGGLGLGERHRRTQDDRGCQGCSRGPLHKFLPVQPRL